MSTQDDFEPIVSLCPHCQSARLQCYEWQEVQEPLCSGQPIKAFCEICAKEWELSRQERDELTRLKK